MIEPIQPNLGMIGRMSAVDQGYRYAINLPCDWILVTSIRQTRLYHKGSDQHTYERFDTEELAGNEGLLRKFVFLLAAERVVPVQGRCHLYDLLTASEKVGQQLTKDFYLRYADMRQDAFETLCEANPSESRHIVLSVTQKLLDRVLFVASRRTAACCRKPCCGGPLSTGIRSTLVPSGRTSAACFARSTPGTSR